MATLDDLFKELLQPIHDKLERIEHMVSGDENGLKKEAYRTADLQKLGYSEKEARKILRAYGVNTFGQNRISRANLNKYMNGEDMQS